MMLITPVNVGVHSVTAVCLFKDENNVFSTGFDSSLVPIYFLHFVASHIFSSLYLFILLIYALIYILLYFTVVLVA